MSRLVTSLNPKFNPAKEASICAICTWFVALQVVALGLANQACETCSAACHLKIEDPVRRPPHPLPAPSCLRSVPTRSLGELKQLCVGSQLLLHSLHAEVPDWRWVACHPYQSMSSTNNRIRFRPASHGLTPVASSHAMQFSLSLDRQPRITQVPSCKVIQRLD